MMGHRTAHCEFLGGFRIFDHTGADVPLPVIKGAAIIAYLYLLGSNRASRNELTGLLWGDKPEATARSALRQCLHQMKSKLASFEPEFLTVTQHDVSLDPNKLSADIDALLDPEKIPEAARPGDIDPYQFLLGFEDLDPNFSDWLWSARAQLDQNFRATLKSVLSDANATAEQRLRAAQHLNKLDPSQEIAARLLIENAARDGDLVALLRVYQKLWDALEEEWGEEPSADLQDFVGQTRLRFGDVPESHPAKSENTPFRKYLTILALSFHGGAAETEMLDTLLNRAKEAIVTRGGTIFYSDADKLCGVFGLQFSVENNARDSIEVALELRELLGGHQGIRIGVGLDTGYVLVEPPASSGQHPKISGAVIDQAMALAQHETDFAIAATARTMHGLEAFYLTSQAPPTQMGTTPTVRVIARNAAATIDALRGMRETFVGRTPFLAALWEIWTDSLETQSLQIASLQGQAGVGKTRLADEFLRRLAAEGIRTVRAECNRYDRSAPLEPLIDLLRAFEADTETAPEGSGRSLMHAGSGRQSLTIDAIVAQLTAALDGRPAAIFIDDWQWADDATRLALGKLTTSAARSSLLLILTSRNVPADEWLVANSHQIVLPNLTAREVVEKAELHINRPIDGRLKQQILAKSSGNPLLLEEVCHAIGNSPFAQDRDGVIAELPANVQALFATRFEQLALEELEIVFAAATHGDQVERELLSKVILRPVSSSAYDRLCEHDVLVMAGAGKTIRFKHGLARDVAYNMIPDDRRRALHLAYANCLRKGASREDEYRMAERLAFHYRGGGDIANASDFAELSGDKALKASAHDQAIWHYGVALDLVDQLPSNDTTRRRWISLAARWAIPTTYTPSHEQISLLERAETLAKQIGDLHSVAALRYWIGYSTYVLGENASGLKSLRLARQVADSVGNFQQSTEAKAIEGCALASIANYDEAERMMRDAIETKDRHPHRQNHAPVTSVYTRANLALLIADRGDFEESRKLIEEALYRVRDFEHEVESSILLFSGTINIWRGAWEDALDDARRARERSERVSSPYLMGMSRCIWGYAHWRIHGGVAGLDTLAKNARWMRDRDMQMYYTFICGWLADAMAESGRSQEAEAAYRLALDRASSGEIAGAAMACRASALCAISEERYDDAAQRLSQAKDFAARRSAMHEVAANHLLSARLHYALNRQGNAIAALETAKAQLARLGLPQRYQMACDVEAELSHAHASSLVTPSDN